MTNVVQQLALQLIENATDPKRPNRLCVSLSDIHLTDGSVGYQNLGDESWEAFYSTISARCLRYRITELTFVLDGDIVDMIRTDKWAKNGIYPWQRERKEEFSRVTYEIIQEIVEEKHKAFFQWLRELPQKLQRDASVDSVKIVLLLGNHDKELLCDQMSLAYFYEHGLGQKLENISPAYRRDIGRMYGDEEMFADPTTAPYFPFYYGDTGFRFFTTHGQWRDADNSRSVKAGAGLPAWSVKNGWQNEVWQQLKFTPFLLPCFGDTVAAGVLSTFIFRSKKALKALNYHNDRLMTILDELDLYRPTYKALSRLLEETRHMRQQKRDPAALDVIETTLYECVMQWLSWDFTYQTSPLLRSVGLRGVKVILKIMKVIGFKLEIKTIAALLKLLTGLERWNPYHKTDVSFKEMSGFPAFLPIYQHYGFQIHGEGHTHLPLEEEANFERKHPSTYINFGTWRDQIIGRKESGYRRRGVLRALYILDLQDTTAGASSGDRSFDYYTDDIIHWNDKSDGFSRKGKHQPHI